MTTAKVETLVWVAIYLGLLLLGLGLSVQRSATLLGWAIASLGIVLTLAGIALVYVRSRMNDQD